MPIRSLSSISVRVHPTDDGDEVFIIEAYRGKLNINREQARWLVSFLDRILKSGVSEENEILSTYESDTTANTETVHE